MALCKELLTFWVARHVFRGVIVSAQLSLLETVHRNPLVAEYLITYMLCQFPSNKDYNILMW